MSENISSIDELLKKYNIQSHDLEYILNFMQKEGISPQLAMRRIKLFEKLQEKMSKTQSDEKVRELTTELDHLSKLVEDLQNEKSDLDKEIEDTRLQQDLFNAEREELKMQMTALMGSIESIVSVENQDLKKKIEIMTAGCQTLKAKVLKISYETPSLNPLIDSIDRSLDAVIAAKQVPHDTNFSVPQDLLAASPQSAPVSVQGSSDTISPDKIEISTAPKIVEKPASASRIGTPASVKQESSPAPATTDSSKPMIKENIFAEPDEVEKTVSQPKPESRPAPEPEPEPIPVQKTEPLHSTEHRPKAKPTKVDTRAKPSTDDNIVSPKIEKILKLFISYGQQADSDENWKARISAICDMDEAYVELGGLAMSQIYSYQTQSIKKKKEFERLLNSWMENGLPR
ncbi:MAG: hypothetical protein ACTSQF_07590 [Candidatus Heimdallarchaeaceae archaeon]